MYSLGIDIGGTNIKFLKIHHDDISTEKTIIKTPKNIIKKNVIKLNYPEIFETVNSYINYLGIKNITKITLSGQMHSSMIVKNSKIIDGPYSWQSQVMDEKNVNQIINELQFFDDIKKGYPLFNLKDNLNGQYHTILTKLFGDLTGINNRIHISEAAGTGLFGLESNTWNKQLIDKLNLNNIYFPKVISNKHFYFHKFSKTKVSIPFGDFQMSMDANLSKNTKSISINIATGGQVSILKNNSKSLYQTRPSFYKNLTYDCYTQLPAGRFINYLEKQMGRKKSDFSNKLLENIDPCPDLFSINEIQKYINVKKAYLSYEEIMHSLLKKYIYLLKQYNKKYNFQNIVLSGSILEHYKLFEIGIRDHFKDKNIYFNKDDVLKNHQKILLNNIKS